MSQQDKEKAQARQQVDLARQQKIEHKKKLEASKPVEFELCNISEEMRHLPALAKCLKVSKTMENNLNIFHQECGIMSDLKWTSDDMTSAYVKLLAQEQTAEDFYTAFMAKIGAQKLFEVKMLPKKGEEKKIEESDV